MSYTAKIETAIERGNAGVVEDAALAYAAMRDGQHKQAVTLAKDIWPMNMRAVPKMFVRTSLFQLVADGGEAPWEESVPARVAIYSLETEIEYVGFSLSQFDLSVWASIAHLSRAAGYALETDGITLLRDVLGNDAAVGTKEYDKLRTALKRLAAATIFVRDLGGKDTTERSYKVLDLEIVSEAGTGRMKSVKLKISPETSALLVAGKRVELRHQDEIALARSPLALKLYRFYESHDGNPKFPYSINKLRLLCGASNTPLVEFRKSVRRAVEKLVEIGFITEGTIDTKGAIDRRDCLILQRKKRE